ncbi:MAG TPA: hypothetical protein VGZ22_27885 [Isosphaeraceae bacterium]|nr:hypothetical protein [Isosphaeraceae bacterium]
MISDRRPPLKRRSRRVWLEGALALALTGCSGQPKPGDPVVAEQTLRAALDAWKSGEAAPTLAERRPPIYVVDHEWQSGLKLVRYEIEGSGEALGFDLRCAAKLWLQDPRAQKVQRKAVYTVATHPVQTVVREDP